VINNNEEAQIKLFMIRCGKAILRDA